MNEPYKRQVALLLSVLPEVAKESCFALHGGTAINLFVRDMPRLSVDIDLTYIPIEERTVSLDGISAALERIKANVENAIHGVRVIHRKDAAKLAVSLKGAEIKLEVNLTGRGLIDEPVVMQLCQKAQEEFDAFVAMQVVPIGQLYGGKICAALDRQHPRDMFDVKYLLNGEGLTDEIKKGFLYCLLGSDRPFNEVIGPNYQDQRSAMANQFAGMTFEPFNYEEYESIRESLVNTIRGKLTDEDKRFLLSVKNLTPDWTLYDFERFPSVQWKMQNLIKLKENNPDKHRGQFEALEKKLKEYT